jgi:hypothetical protein
LLEPPEGLEAAVMVKVGVHVASGALFTFWVVPHSTPDTFMTLVPAAPYVVEPFVDCHALGSAG